MPHEAKCHLGRAPGVMPEYHVAQLQQQQQAGVQMPEQVSLGRERCHRTSLSPCLLHKAQTEITSRI